jgi:hypothetical protein
MRRFWAIGAVTMLLFGSVLSVHGQQRSIGDVADTDIGRTKLPVGVVVIDPEMGDWHSYQRPLFRASNFDLAKVHIAPGFNTEPSHVRDLIADGARVVMFKTEDCETDPGVTYTHLVDQGFHNLLDEYSDVTFVMQVGNEPERCNFTMDEYFEKLVGVATLVRPALDRENLQWVAGLPMEPDSVFELIVDDGLLDHFDAVGTNMLGHFSLTEERHGWHEIVDFVLEETDADLWITELGINHPPMDKAEKARRLIEYIDTLPPDRVRGVAIFALAQGSGWPQYEYVESMVPVFNDRESCHYFVAVDNWVCDGFKSFWDQYGGLAIFGYPITGEFRDAVNRNVQYFERARFEWHPGVWPEQHNVLLGHLGWESLERAEDDAILQADSPLPGCRYFSETRQNLCDEFLDYWERFGGLPVFGFPISQRFAEDNVKVQYFERARFEYHPGVWPERFDVLQGRLGAELREYD